MNTIAKQIKAMREAAGMSLTTLAEKSSVNRMTLHRIEQGGDVRLQTLDDVLRVLGVEVALVPKGLRTEVQQFIQAGGKLLGRPAGVEAPPSVIAVLTSRNREPESVHSFLRNTAPRIPVTPETQGSFLGALPVQTSKSSMVVMKAGDLKNNQGPPARRFTTLPSQTAEFMSGRMTEPHVQGSIQYPGTLAGGPTAGFVYVASGEGVARDVPEKAIQLTHLAQDKGGPAIGKSSVGTITFTTKLGDQTGHSFWSRKHAFAHEFQTTAPPALSLNHATTIYPEDVVIGIYNEPSLASDAKPTSGITSMNRRSATPPPPHSKTSPKATANRKKPL